MIVINDVHARIEQHTDGGISYTGIISREFRTFLNNNGVVTEVTATIGRAYQVTFDTQSSGIIQTLMNRFYVAKQQSFAL